MIRLGILYRLSFIIRKLLYSLNWGEAAPHMRMSGIFVYIQYNNSQARTRGTTCNSRKSRVNKYYLLIQKFKLTSFPSFAFILNFYLQTVYRRWNSQKKDVRKLKQVSIVITCSLKFNQVLQWRSSEFYVPAHRPTDQSPPITKFLSVASHS